MEKSKGVSTHTYIHASCIHTYTHITYIHTHHMHTYIHIYINKIKRTHITHINTYIYIPRFTVEKREADDHTYIHT